MLVNPRSTFILEKKTVTQYAEIKEFQDFQKAALHITSKETPWKKKAQEALNVWLGVLSGIMASEPWWPSVASYL